MGAFAPPRGSAPPPSCPPVSRKNGQNQPFSAIFWIFAISETYFAPSIPPQKIFWCRHWLSTNTTHSFIYLFIYFFFFALFCFVFVCVLVCVFTICVVSKSLKVERFVYYISWYILLYRIYDVKLFDWLTAHNWQYWKRVFLTCPCHKIYRDEAVGLKIYLKNYDICKNVKFGASSWIFDILSITA